MTARGANLRGALWLGLYLLVVAAPLVLLLVGPMPPGRGFWFDFSMGLGFAGMAMFGVQFVLTARFKRVSAPFGIDIIYLFHRYLAIIALGIVLSHFAILWLFYEEVLGELDPRKARWELTAGRVALVCFALLVVSSLWRQRLRLEYGWWRLAHVALAILGFGAAIAHIGGVGHYTEAPGKQALWLAITAAWVGLIIWIRVVRPSHQIRRPYRITGLRSEANDTWRLTLEPQGHRGLRRFRPGQFAWLTVGQSPFRLGEHPFSILSPPEDLPRLEFGVKELGDFTAGVKELQMGETVYVDAPYGVFSIDGHRTAPGFGLIAGGVGVTPCLSMLRSMARRGDRRPVWLFYCNKSADEIAFAEDLEALNRVMRLTVVHVLEEPPVEWEGESGFLKQQILERHLPPERAELHYFLCGPTPMVAAAKEGLGQLGVPLHRMQTELFELV